MNIHPSLLPAFPGKDAMGQALAAKVAAAVYRLLCWIQEWIQVQLLPKRKSVLRKMKRYETLQMKIHAMEHQLYPAVLQNLMTQKGGSK